MKAKPTTALIGAAGLTFGPKVLRDLTNFPELQGSTIRFVDVDEEHLQVLDRLARRLCEEAGRSYQTESTTDREAALRGADYIVCQTPPARCNQLRRPIALVEERVAAQDT
jgi:alpha-galactosidase/6-phospho-beta-glucosidase family protein